MAFSVQPPFWQAWWFIAILVLALAAITFAGLRYLAYRRYRRRMAQLREQEARNEERRRSAMDLHDDLGAELNGLLLLARVERSKHPTSNLERMEQVASALSEKVNEVIWSSDPVHDTLEGALAFIERHVADRCKGHALAFRRHGDARLPASVLSAGQRRDLFLAVKEAVANTLKHAHAAKVVMDVRVTGGSLVLTLTDDGRGMPAHGSRGTGNGLANIQRRMAGLGGRSTVEAMPEGGTRVILTMPLEAIGRTADAHVRSR